MNKFEKVSVRLTTSVLNKIKAQAIQNERRVSDYLRHLIELGLKVEELPNTSSDEKKLEALVYKSVLENLMLTRAMMRNSNHIDKEQQEKYLLKARESAVKMVNKFWGEDCLIDE